MTFNGESEFRVAISNRNADRPLRVNFEVSIAGIIEEKMVSNGELIGPDFYAICGRLNGSVRLRRALRNRLVGLILLVWAWGSRLILIRSGIRKSDRNRVGSRVHIRGFGTQICDEQIPRCFQMTNPLKSGLRSTGTSNDLYRVFTADFYGVPTRISYLVETTRPKAVCLF